MAEDNKLDVSVAAKFPGQDLFEKLVDLWKENRATMSQENRDRWDYAIYVGFKAWNNWWVKHGWPGEELP